MRFPNIATITAPFHHKPTNKEIIWISLSVKFIMVGIRAVPVRADVARLLRLNESLRNKFLESHIRISYETLLLLP